MPPTAPLGFYWGDDSYGVNHAPDALADRLAGEGPPLDRLRLTGSTTSAGEIAEKVATATLFGGGTLVVVSEPAPLVATKPLATVLVEALGAVAPGNGLAFLDSVDGTARRPASLENLRSAVAAAGGEIREFRAPTQEGMAHWIVDRAHERGIRISAAAAAELARRVGANVRERDVDRRRQGELAVAELEKLALYRLDGQIVPEDVVALVADVVPGSTWAFLDAVGLRRAADAAELAERLDEVPAPLLVTHLHRRIKQLIEVADLLDAGTPAPEIVRAIKVHSFVAEKLATQSRAWAPPELDAALEGQLELDAELKGHSGGGELRRRAAISLWIAERVRRPGRNCPPWRRERRLAPRRAERGAGANARRPQPGSTDRGPSGQTPAVHPAPPAVDRPHQCPVAGDPVDDEAQAPVQDDSRRPARVGVIPRGRAAGRYIVGR